MFKKLRNWWREYNTVWHFANETEWRVEKEAAGYRRLGLYQKQVDFDGDRQRWVPASGCRYGQTEKVEKLPGLTLTAID